jgi:Filamin/ABP280 repeat
LNSCSTIFKVLTLHSSIQVFELGHLIGTIVNEATISLDLTCACLQIDKPATFNVNLNNAIGTLKATVKTPSGTEEDVFSQELDQDEYAMRFMPKENGVYYVYVRFNEAHIPGSPFPMLVGKLGADPALVFARGDGLEKGEVG